MQAEKKSLEVQTTIAGLVKNKINNKRFHHVLGVEQLLREGTDVDRVNEDIEVGFFFFWVGFFFSRTSRWVVVILIFIQNVQNMFTG